MASNAASILTGTTCSASAISVVRPGKAARAAAAVRVSRANNAIAMTAGAVILLTVSFGLGEGHALPADVRGWSAVAYVSLAGTAAVFSLFVHVVQRWTASSTSYVMLLMPFVTVAVAVAVLGQTITPAFLVGGALVIAGVYVGAIGRHRAARSIAPPASPARVVTTLPGCA